MPFCYDQLILRTNPPFKYHFRLKVSNTEDKIEPTNEFYCLYNLLLYYRILCTVIKELQTQIAMCFIILWPFSDLRTTSIYITWYLMQYLKICQLLRDIRISTFWYSFVLSPLTQCQHWLIRPTRYGIPLPLGLLSLTFLFISLTPCSRKLPRAAAVFWG